MTDVFGNWVIDSKLGQGGMGDVFRVRHRESGKAAALKIARDGDPRKRKAIVREVQIMSALQIGVATLLDFNLTGNDPWYVMELVDGLSLRELLATKEPKSVIEQTTVGSISMFALPDTFPNRIRGELDFARFEACAPVLLAALSSLANLHAVGIVHADLKPEHIFLTPSGVKFVDFGLSSIAPGVQGRVEVRLRSTGAGTRNYLPPEQGNGLPVDARADIFAMGCVMRECLFGNPQYERWQDAEIPAELAELLTDMLNPDPAQRLAYAMHVANRLAEVLGQPVLPDTPAYIVSSTLQGRDDDRKAIEGILSASRGVYVRGDFGVGKSRLADDIARRYSRWADVRICTLSHDESEQWATIVPDSGLQHGPSVLRHIASQPNDGHVLWVVDNAELATSSVAQLFRALVANLPNHTVLALGRDVGEFAGRMQVYELSPIRIADVAEISRQVIGKSTPLDTTFVRRLLERTEGNPLLVVDTMRRLIQEHGPNVERSSIDLGAIQQDHVEAIFLSRLQEVPESLRWFLLAIERSVEVPYRWCARLGVTDLELETLLSLRLVRRGEYIVLAHGAFGRLVLANLNTPEHRAVCLRQMAKLERSHRSDVAVVRTKLVHDGASHIDAACDLADTLAEGTHPVLELALRESVRKQWHLLSNVRRNRECLKLGRAKHRFVGAEYALVEWEDALSAADPASDVWQEAMAMKMHVLAAQVRIDELEESIRQARSFGNSKLQAESELCQGTAHYHHGDLHAARKSFRAAQHAFERLGELQGWARATSNIATILTLLNKVHESRELFKHASEVQLTIGDKEQLQRSLTFIATLDYFDGRFREAVTGFGHAVSLNASRWVGSDGAVLLHNLAMSHWHLGERAAGTETLLKAVDLCTFSQDEADQCLVWCSLAKVRIHERNYDDAQTWIRRAAQAAKKTRGAKPSLAGFVSQALAKLARKKNDVHGVLTHTSNDLRASFERNMYRKIIGSHLMRAKWLRELGVTDKPSEALESAIQHLKRADHPRLWAMWHAEKSLLSPDHSDAANYHRQKVAELTTDQVSLRVDFAEECYLELLGLKPSPRP